MARYIDADKAEERFKEIYCDNCDSRNGIKCSACGLRDGADVFSDAPTEDVQPVVRGGWSNSYPYRCSVCNSKAPYEFDVHDNDVIMIKSKYCPSCGARMTGVREKFFREVIEDED